MRTSKKRISTSNKIAAAVAAVAVTGAFGAGAYAVVQDGSSFDPKGFTSAYNKGAQDEQQGFQATQTDTNAQANRHKDDANNNDTSAENSSQRDAFSKLSDNGKGTTAASVDSNAKPGTSANAGDGSGNDADGNDASKTPVIDGDGDNPTPAPNNPTPSNPNSPGDDTDNPSDNTGGDDDSSSTSKPANVIKGEDPTLDTKPTDSNSWGDTSYKIVNDNITYTDDDVKKRGDEWAIVIDSDTSVDNCKLYAGKSANAWDLFVSMNTWYVDNDLNTVYWACDKKDFAKYSKKYFMINYVAWDDTVVKAEDFPFVVPDGPFTVNITYRVGPNAKPHTVNVTYDPFTILNYIVNPFVDSDVADILAKNSNGTVNLAYWNSAVIQAANSLGAYGTIVDENGYLKQLLSGWKETSSDGKNDKPVPDYFTASNGRHVYAPDDFVAIDPEYKAKLNLYWANSNGEIPSDNSGSEIMYLQTLTGLEGRQFADDLAVQPGIQAIDIEQSEIFTSDVPSLLVNYLEIPSSVRYVNISSNTLAVEEGFRVSDDNTSYSATDDGILTNAAQTEYLAVPTNRKELTVPDNITRVALSKYNNPLETINIETEDPDGLPALENAHLSGCKIVVKNKSVLKQALVDYASLLSPDDGNYLSIEGEGDFFIKDGLVTSNGELVETTSDDVSIVDISGISKIRKGAFVEQGDPKNPDTQLRVSNVKTIVLGSDQNIEFEKGCFDGSAIEHIVCSSNEQKTDIEAKLSAIGIDSNTIHVAVKETATDGSVYFSCPESKCTYSAILSAPADIVSFDGTLVAQNGSTIDITAIGPRAFKDCADLKWLPLKKSIDFIGTGAFSGCTSLEILFIENTDTITVESDIFSNCDNVAFFASRAMTANFAGNEVPSYNTVMYCPTNSEGYTGGFQWFTEQSNVDDFALIPQEDGSYLLYGCRTYSKNGSPTPWLCLSSSTSTSGKVSLPSTTVEIFNRAFAEKKSSFSVNWDELSDLTHVDYQAFYNSGVSGTVSFKDRITIGKEAFNGCAGITSLVSTGPSFSTGESAFAGCRSLASIKIGSSGGANNSNNFGAGTFNNCDAIKAFELTDPDPATLTLYDYNYPFTFNFDWDDNENYKGVINVPDDCLETYLNNWVYPFAGYADYDSLESDVKFNLRMNNDWVDPTEEEVRKGVLEKLLPAENKLRMLLGAEQVSDVTIKLPGLTHEETCDGFTFNVKDGVATLTGTPENVENGVVDFTGIVPEEWTDVTIPTGAFENCAGIKKIILSDNIETIENDAFKGLNDIEIVLAAHNVALLKGGEFSNPYSFGADSVKLSAPGSITSENSKRMLINSYLTSWTMNSLGCKGIEDFYWEAASIASNMDGAEATDIDVCRVVDTKIMAQENIFRKMLGLEKIADLDALATSYAKDYCGLTYPTENADSKTANSDASDKTSDDTDISKTQGNSENPSKSDTDSEEGISTIDFLAENSSRAQNDDDEAKSDELSALEKKS